MAMVWKLQAVVVFSVSEETKFEVDTSLPSSFPRGVKFPLWKTRWQWILDLITATKILKCFKIKGSRKWRKRFKIENLLSWQNIFNSRQITADREKKQPIKEKSLVEESAMYLPFLIKQMETMPRSHQQLAT